MPANLTAQYRAAEAGYRAAKGREDQQAALEELGFQARSAADSTRQDDEKRKDTEGVFVVRDGYVKFVPVEIGIAGENDFELIEGVTEGETVVTGPFRILRELKDGSLVERAKAEKRDRR